MAILNCYATFGFSGVFDPIQLSDQLKLEPSWFIKRGDMRVTSFVDSVKSRVRSEPSTISVWSFSTENRVKSVDASYNLNYLIDIYKSVSDTIKLLEIDPVFRIDIIFEKSGLIQLTKNCFEKFMLLDNGLSITAFSRGNKDIPIRNFDTEVIDFKMYDNQKCVIFDENISINDDVSCKINELIQSTSSYDTSNFIKIIFPIFGAESFYLNCKSQNSVVKKHTDLIIEYHGYTSE